MAQTMDDENCSFTAKHCSPFCLLKFVTHSACILSSLTHLLLTHDATVHNIHLDKNVWMH